MSSIVTIFDADGKKVGKGLVLGTPELGYMGKPVSAGSFAVSFNSGAYSAFYGDQSNACFSSLSG